MPTPDALPEPPFPPRVVWFAPWRWKRRNIVISLWLVFLIGYPLSIGPALRLVRMSLIDAQIVAWLYRPVLFCSWRCGSEANRTLIAYMQSWDSDLAAGVFMLHWIWEAGTPTSITPYVPLPPSAPPATPQISGTLETN